MKLPILSVLLAWFVIIQTDLYAFTIPVDADMVVASDGSGDFTSLQAAIDAVPANSDKQTIIYIKRGLYNTEKLFVPADKKNVYLIGESRDETIISYHIYDCASGKCPVEDAAKWTGDVIKTSATLTVYGDGFKAENLTIRNTAGPVGQALALTIVSDKNVFVNCNIESYQDTIYLWISGKRSYFKDCLVVGRTDYIYGAGIGFFHNCEIRSWGGGWITAPSTPQAQPYGFVFYECQVTYALGSPRAGDDGALVALGRPWHEYPKVAWLYCEMTDKIDPLGWPTTWNMDYAATSADLHLYEYGNTGGGADMSGRADWAGIRALTAEEAANYTPQQVLAGSDGWDPTATPPLINTFLWTGNDASDGWLIANNWDPVGIPAAGEAAGIEGVFTVDADGGTFEADLSARNGVTLNVAAASTVTYAAVGGITFTAAGDVSLGGKLATKDSLVADIAGKLTLDASLTGVHDLYKTGAGALVVNNNNADYTGQFIIQEGTLEAPAAGSLGKGDVTVKSGATFTVGHSSAFYVQSKLEVVTGASLVLNADITLSEFYIDGAIQATGEYTAATHPALISGTGKILVGRPDVFYFTGGSNGNWDVASHFSPALLPEAGETVIVEREIETTSWVFPADLVITNKGTVRLRGVHSATGTIEMQQDARMSYATSGTGFTLDAPIQVTGDIFLRMSSANAAGSSMVLPGTITGSTRIMAANVRDCDCLATVVLGGDNSGFSGVWDVTTAGPNAAAVTAIEGTVANAFGTGSIEVSNGNKVILSHASCAGDALALTLSSGGMAVLNTDVTVNTFMLNGNPTSAGTYTAASHPDVFEGDGSLTVLTGTDPDPVTNVDDEQRFTHHPLRLQENIIYVDGEQSILSLYTINGQKMIEARNSKAVPLGNLTRGVYIVKYLVDKKYGVMKIGR